MSVMRAEFNGSFMMTNQHIRVANNGHLALFNPAASGKVINIHSFRCYVFHTAAMASQVLYISKGYFLAAMTPVVTNRLNKNVGVLNGLGVADLVVGDSATGLSLPANIHIDPRGLFVSDTVELIKGTPVRLEESHGFGIEWQFSTFAVNAIVEYEEI